MKTDQILQNDTHRQTKELKRKKKEFWDDDRKNLFLLNFVDLFSLLVFAHFLARIDFVFKKMYIYIGIILVAVVMARVSVVHDGYTKLRHFVIGKHIR